MIKQFFLPAPFPSPQQKFFGGLRGAIFQKSPSHRRRQGRKLLLIIDRCGAFLIQSLPMKKIIKFLFLVLFCAAVLGLLYVLLFKPEEKNFVRVEPENFSLDTNRFRVDKKLRKIYFRHTSPASRETGKNAKKAALSRSSQGKKNNPEDKKKETWLAELPTIEGFPFYLKGKRSLQIFPRLTGAVSFYTYLYFDNLQKKEKIQFFLEVYRKGKSIEIHKIKAAKYSHRYFRDLKLEKNDRLLLKFKGRGVVFFSKPVFYKKGAAPKNIFLIAADTLRWDQVGAEVAGKPLTPYLDEFTRDCLSFKNAYAQCPWTLPSFMSLFTGRCEFNHRVNSGRPLDPQIPLLIEKISEKFITFGFHSGMGMRKRWGYSRGFDYYHKVPYTSPLFPKAAHTLFHEAAALLEKSRFPDFFFFLHTYQVHDPYTPPEEFLLKLNREPKYKKLAVVNQNAPWKTFQPVDEELKEAYIELYRAEIHAFDAYFGAFMQKLKQLGLYDNAMIIFLSDHGEEFYEHRGWTHSHSLYDELIKVPLLIKFPGAEFKGLEIGENAGLIDLIPTILSYYKIGNEAAKIDGIDLMPLIRGEESLPREFLISSISESRYIRQIPAKFAFIHGDYKIIYNEEFSDEDLEYFRPYGLPPQTPKIEVYNLKEDPLEKRNIAARQSALVKRVMPIIVKIKKIIRDNLLRRGKEQGLDDEARKQLESLGYI